MPVRAPAAALAEQDLSEHPSTLSRMTTLISDVRTEQGSVDGDVVVGSGGNLTLLGLIHRTLTVAADGYAHVCGTVQQLVVRPGGRAQLDGLCVGDAHNQGGELTVNGTVSGSIVGRIGTQIAANSAIGR